ncbi:GIY-YIG nuclease family protein [Gracilibacillus thailandensis]|jgi:putative endonuclease|uniref:GIY-YIG nuclease family protein n=1 Tax=Gracilibacillus thailandensis TaxID=563735 RepID=A0A6N7R520_9BACI|nr:GIY-YIG nuclease family protein [Gracilibacillus thailandensis]MRI68331.1 GIY-YIG nuclease family protein [Gracilibacillus thailandensis]
MGEKNNHFVYILKCKDETLYTGYTTDIERRMKMHEQGRGAKYTRGRAPFQLQYQQQCKTKSEAMQLEAKIKKLTRKQKELWIKENQTERYGVYADTEELPD